MATASPFEGGVDWRQTDPLTYTFVVFVCGPAGNGPPLTDFFDHFRHRQVIGINLSMLESLEIWNPFALLIERDSSRGARPDLALLPDAGRVPVVGLVLIDSQPEYSSHHMGKAHALIDRFVAGRDMAVVRIDTRLDANQTGLRTAAEVESLIARMDVVITTRLHGTVLALKHGVPVIAIDTVAGGAKVTRQVRSLGWSVGLAAEDLTLERMASAFDVCLSPEARARALECRARAMPALLQARHDFIEFVRVTAADGR